MKNRVFLMYAVLIMLTLSQLDTRASTDIVKCPADPTELSVIPVKFKSRMKTPEGDLLSGTTEMLRFTNQEFIGLLPNDVDCPFFERDGNWQIQIPRSRFVEKKYKDEFWLVYYTQNKDNNIIYMATQFKDIAFLRANFAEGVDVGLGSIEGIDYWNQIRGRQVAGLDIQDDQISWLTFTKNIKAGDADIRFEDGSLAKTLERGSYKIHPNTIFTTAEEETSSRTIPLVGARDLKIRAKQVQRRIFEDNYRKFNILCFYDKNSNVLVRVSMPRIDQQVTPTAHVDPKKKQK